MGKQLKDIAYSVLDLVPVREGGSPAESFRNSLELARLAERCGYTRYWLAEHHNMPGIASSATAVGIAYIAAGTRTIRVGSGGVMLPNHAPLVVAEQFGTLESMFPGRIDLCLGRAPGTDFLTARALRRDVKVGGQDFPELLAELLGYLAPASPAIAPGSPVPSPVATPALSTAAPGGIPGPAVRAIPGEGMNIPIWLLGSSDFSARLAAQLGLPFAFASHFAPENTLPALELYRREFRPSAALAQPYVMVGVNVIIADDDATARRLATSQQQQFLNLVRGRPGRLQPPVDELDWSEAERAAFEKQFSHTFAGSPETVRARLQAFLDETQADEMIINTVVYDHEARMRSVERTAALFR
jgi:luciferase family oxidoreductase group 1